MKLNISELKILGNKEVNIFEFISFITIDITADFRILKTINCKNTELDEFKNNLRYEDYYSIYLNRTIYGCQGLKHSIIFKNNFKEKIITIFEFKKSQLI